MPNVLDRRTLVRSVPLLPLLPRLAKAQGRPSARPVRIGVLTDLTGPYADSGEGSLLAAQMAVEDYAKVNPALRVEVVPGDMQGKTDNGLTIAREWLDRGEIDAIADIPQSALALAVAGLVRERDKVGLLNSPLTSDLTTKACSPNHVQWTYDTYSLGGGTAGALMAEGDKSWFFITADYAFGRTMANDTAALVRKGGGTVTGEVAHPFPGVTDFSAFLLQAQASRARVIAFANAGNDTINCVKQAHEFGLTQGGRQRLAALLLVLSGVHAIGLETAQDLVMSEPFYWDMTDETRSWSRRFQRRNPRDAMPLSPAAGCYSAIIHYLKAVDALGSEKAKASGKLVVEQMKRAPTEDALFGRNTVRADGRFMNPMHLFRVKAPSRSKYPWDYLETVRTTPADQVYRPLAEGGCAFLKG